MTTIREIGFDAFMAAHEEAKAKLEASQSLRSLLYMDPHAVRDWQKLIQVKLCELYEDNERGFFESNDDTAVDLLDVVPLPERAKCQPMVVEFVQTARLLTTCFQSGLRALRTGDFDEANSQFTLLRQNMRTQKGERWVDWWLEYCKLRRDKKPPKDLYRWGPLHDQSTLDGMDEREESNREYLRSRLLVEIHANRVASVSPIGDYIVRGFINGGATGSVFAVRKSNARYACKTIERAGKEAEIQHELQALGKAREYPRIKHVVEFVQLISTEQFDSIIMSPEAVMDLSDHLRDASGSSLDERYAEITMDITQFKVAKKECLEWIHCLLVTLAALHERDIRHRDIGPANLLIGYLSGVGRTIIFADFSLSYSEGFGTEDRPNAKGGQRHYCPPEAFDRGQNIKMGDDNDQAGPSPGKRRDVFSLGCVIYEMLDLFTATATMRLPSPDLRYADSISDPDFLKKVSSFEDKTGSPPQWYYRTDVFNELSKELLEILFESMIVEQRRRTCAACALDKMRQAMRQHGIGLGCCRELFNCD